MTEALASILRPVDMYPGRKQTAFSIHWPFDSPPISLKGQTRVINGSRVFVRDVIEDFGGIDASGQSVILVADRVE